MNNANNKFIALTYKLYVDGDHGKEMVEEAKADRPFHFISGFGFALDAFEQQVISLEKGAQFSFSLLKTKLMVIMTINRLHRWTVPYSM